VEATIQNQRGGKRGKYSTKPECNTRLRVRNEERKWLVIPKKIVSAFLSAIYGSNSQNGEEVMYHEGHLHMDRAGWGSKIKEVRIIFLIPNQQESD